jgi:hypothetical protein
VSEFYDSDLCKYFSLLCIVNNVEDGLVSVGYGTVALCKLNIWYLSVTTFTVVFTNGGVVYFH